jgi:hypothetical protein
LAELAQEADDEEVIAALAPDEDELAQFAKSCSLSLPFRDFHLNIHVIEMNPTRYQSKGCRGHQDDEIAI